MSVLVNDSDSVIKPFSPTVAKPPVPAVKYRDFGDAVTARDSIYQSVLDTTRNLQPLTNTKHTLALSGVDYAEPGNFTLKQQKEAILTGKTLGRRLVGTWELRNNADGQVLDSKRMTLAKVPYMTDRGTFIHNGSEYTLSNQMRLRPGIFTRVKDNGEVEAHANIMPGKGASHRYFLDPAKGIFYVKFGQAKIPLMPLVKALGAKDSDLQKSWGNELWQANAQKNDPVTLNKILAKLVRKIDPEAPLENKYKAIKDAIEKMEVDPEVTQSTLGIPMKNLNLDGIMATTKKLLAVSRGESEVDDRDHLLFQNIYGPEDLLAERIAKDAGGIRRALFYKSSFKNNLSSMQPGLLTKQLESALLHSGLGQCFDDKTSVLTARGWLLWSEVTADDLFACEIDGVLTYHKAYKLHEYDYDGELLGCRTRRFDYLVTPNHRLWCKAKPHAEYRAEYAGIAHCRGRYFSTSLPEQTAAVNTADFILPAVDSGRWRKSTGPKTLPGDVWARFLGWYMAEGWVSEEPGNATRSQRKRVCLAQCNQANPAGHRDIVDVLSKLGFNWRYQASNKTFYINDKQLAAELLRYGKGSANKRLPRYVFQWDSRRLRLLCDSYISGDGNDYNGYIKAETTSLHLAQDLVELFGRLGGTGRITKRLLSEKNPNWADSYVVSFGINRETYVSGSSDCARTGNPLAYYQQRYVGKVYCASVPGEKLYVMRNGKPHWSLNSIEEINPSDVLDKQSRISRMGEGGIPSMDSVPDESRAVQPSHFGFVDPVRTPESLRTGVDAFIANTARKGSDGRFYSPFLNNKGETVWKSPQDLANMTVAFPQEINRNTKRIGVMQGGKIKFVPRQDVDLVMPNFENAFSPLGNMVPIKSAVKAQRMAMASRMLTQALPLEEPEAPLVRTGIAGEPDNSYERKFGRHMGAIVADKPGMVIAADSEKIRVKYDDGTVEDKELYKSFPYNRKTYVDNTPVVRPGDRFGIGQTLAKSNYTDNEGVTALGKNLHVAYLPFKGFNFEDANVISESAAKKLSSQHMYQHGIDWSADYKQGKAAYIGMFANKYDRKTLDKLDDDGVVKEGSIVKYGDPLVLAAKQKEASYGKVHKQRQAAFSDATDTWDHHTDGVVTDVVKTAKGTTVLVKSAAQMEVGDKLSGRFGDKGVIAAIIPDDQMPKDASGQPFEVLLNPLGIISRCYDEQTEFLTNRGWVFGKDVLADDHFVCYQPWTTGLYVLPQLEKFHTADYEGSMLRFENKLMDFCVTPNHRMWAKCGYPGAPWQEVTAERIFRKNWIIPVAGLPVSGTESPFILPHISYSKKDNSSDKSDIVIDAGDWAEFLGWFMSEGNVDDKTHISQSNTANPAKCEMIESLLRRLPFKWHYSEKNTQFHITSIRLCRYLKQFGLCDGKFIPDWLFEQPEVIRQRFLDAYWLGDGSVKTMLNGQHTSSAGSRSSRLIDDLQRLLIYQGLSANKYPIKTKDLNKPMWRVARHYRTERVLEDTNWSEFYYRGKIYCPTVATGYVVTRRNGKIVIAGNTNPAQMVEAALGKIAKKTGKAYNVSDFDSIDDMTEYAIKELQKHGLSDLEDVEDSETGRKIKGVFTGNRFFMKLHHTSASKGQGRGTGGYAMDGTPAKGGETGSKRISVLDSNALLSHGATEVLRDVGSIRGQRNEEFWLPFMQGLPTPKPKIPFIYQKFVNELQASGINVVRDGTTLNIMALTNKDVDALAGDRYIQSGDTVQFEKGMKPVPGGLFDPTLTGGNNGNRWSAIKLHEPMPNPVMEEPIRRLLNLTQKDFNNVIAGKKEIAGHTGTSAIVNALSLLNIDKEIAVARESIKSGRATHRDAAVRKLGYLKAAKDLNMHPKDWILNKAPVLPPIFRPVAVMSDNKMPLVADANYLYKELLEANDNLRDMSKEVDDVGEERLSVYNAFKAVTGLGDPVHPKLQEKQVKGLLKHIFGSSPKFGSVQRRLISSTVDLVGRAVITPNPDLDMDHVGLPEERAWDIYKNFIVRRLKRRGLPLLEAAKQVENRTAVAKKEMLEEMADRPVIINRAPVLHRFGIMAFYPKLVKGNTLQISPLIVKGFNADFDGDAMQYHVPVSDESKKEATERMLPSRNLLSPIDFKSPVHSPSQEYTGGLYTATAGRSGKKTQVFRSLKDAAAAYKRGDLDIDDPVEILS